MPGSSGARGASRPHDLRRPGLTAVASMMAALDPMRISHETQLYSLPAVPCPGPDLVADGGGDRGGVPGAPCGSSRATSRGRRDVVGPVDGHRRRDTIPPSRARTPRPAARRAPPRWRAGSCRPVSSTVSPICAVRMPSRARCAALMTGCAREVGQVRSPRPPSSAWCNSTRAAHDIWARRSAPVRRREHPHVVVQRAAASSPATAPERTRMGDSARRCDRPEALMAARRAAYRRPYVAAVGAADAGRRAGGSRPRRPRREANVVGEVRDDRGGEGADQIATLHPQARTAASGRRRQPGVADEGGGAEIVPVTGPTTKMPS